MKEKEVNRIFPENYATNLSDFALFLAVMKNKDAYESGKRAIRLDAWARDHKNRRINTEMQNDTEHDDIRKRARFYQGLMDSPVLKAGKGTKYKNLPSTIIIFITQEDILGKDMAKHTFSEQCEEIQGLHLGDGTRKIFLNMSSKNGAPELISLLQYMKETRMDNLEILIKDKRIEKLDAIVSEVKQSEECEEMRMSIMKDALEHGIHQGIRQGIRQGREQGSNYHLLEQICKKLKKDKTREQIADELEEELERINYLCDLAITENYDVQRACNKLYEQSEDNK